MQTRVYHLRTLTPIWTGGVDMMSGEAKNTGILGSLRAWYEELRGEEDAKCLFGDPSHCRRFRLEVDSLQSSEFSRIGPKGPETVSAQWSDSFTLRFRFPIYIVKTSDDNPGYQSEVRAIGDELDTLIDYITAHRGLGAKTAHGYGQVRYLKPPQRTPPSPSSKLYWSEQTLPPGTAIRQDQPLLAAYDLRERFSVVAGGSLLGSPNKGSELHVAVFPAGTGYRMRAWTVTNIDTTLQSTLMGVNLY